MTGLAQRLTPPGSVPYPGNHLGLRWRPMIGRDAPAVYALISLIEDDDNAIRRTSVDDIADMMEGENGRDWVDTIVGLDAKRNICAVASVRVLRGIHEAATAVVSAFIHPHWRGRGVGRALLYWQDGRARQMLVEEFGADSEVPASISNLVDAHMTDRRRLYIAAGFFAKRTSRISHPAVERGSAGPGSRHPHGGFPAVVPFAPARPVVGRRDEPLRPALVVRGRGCPG